MANNSKSKGATAPKYELIITEKPSTAVKIASALADGKPVKKTDQKVPFYELSHDGKDIVVASAVGHLYTVAEKEKSFKYPVFDIEWQLTADVEKNSGFSRKYANVIKKLAKKADEFTVATDYDIEGETIGLNIVKYLCKQEDASRMKFSTVTPGDLKEAYKEKTHTLDWGQANAGTTRHILDWLYGINISRALTTSVKTAGSFMILSTGRVQGPALKIVVDREKEIQKFVPEDYWEISLSGKREGKEWSALHKTGRFTEEAEADKIVEKCTGKPAAVDQIESKKKQQAPPTPFDLGGLQSEAYKVFGIRPKDTLSIAQTLYTGAYISYPRTSSQKLPAKIGYRKILTALAKADEYKSSAEFLMEKSLLTPNEGKKDDPAHPAIYPTGVPPEGLSGREEKIYDLIVKRFFATFGKPATRQTDTVHIIIAGEEFLLKGTRTVDPAWHELYRPYVKLKEEELPEFKERDSVDYDSIEKEGKQTQPPKRYTPSSLINELEKRNLGTKSTRADVVEALIRRNYVKGQKSFEATELGVKICEVLEGHIPSIVDEKLTAHFDELLDEIRAKMKSSDEVVDEVEKTLTEILKKFKKEEKETGEELIVAQRLERDIQETLFDCPVCKKGTLRIRFSRKNKKQFIGCDRYPDCEFTAPPPGIGLIKPSDKECESCGWQMVAVIRKGRGPSAGCINPQCPEKVKAEAEQSKMAESAGEGQACQNCDDGKMVIKKGRFGMFLGCDQYPKCKTIVNIPKSEEEAAEQDKQKALAKKCGEGKECPKCGEGKLSLKKSARGFFLGCDKYPKCKTIVKIEE